VKRLLTLPAVGLAALVAQGALATLLSPPWCPDLALLVLIGIGLRWSGIAGGLLLAAFLGYATDLVSGSLLGQHALLRMAAHGLARLGNRHLSLRGLLPQAIFVSALTCANAFAMALITSFFSPGSAVAGIALRELLPQAVANALFFPLVASLTARTVARLGDEDGGQRILPLSPRGRIA